MERKEVIERARKMRSDGKSLEETKTWVVDSSGYISARTGQPLTRMGAQTLICYGQLRKRRNHRKTVNRSKAALGGGNTRPSGGTQLKRLIQSITAMAMKAEDKVALIDLVAGL